MEIIKDKDHYKVKSTSSKKFYEVYPDRPFCTCPHFIFREVKRGGICKHIRAVKELHTKADTITEYLEKHGPTDTITLIETFGEEAVDDAIEKGICIEENSTVRILK